MAKDYVFSPTMLEKYRDSPVSMLMNRYLYRKADTVLNYSEARVGTELHQYAEDSFNYVINKKQDALGSDPASGFIQKTLQDSQERAKSALKLHTSMHMKKGMDSIIDKFGSEFLGSKSKTMYVERKLEEQVTNPNTGKVHNLQGIPDLVTYDAETKIAHIVDLKNIFDQTTKRTFDSADSKLQVKSYSYLVLQDLIKQGIPVDSVQFTFAMNPAYGPVGYQTFEYTAKQIMADIQTELAMNVAKAENYNKMMVSSMKDGASALDSFKKTFTEIISTGACRPGSQCGMCGMKNSCHLYFSQQVATKLQDRNSKLKEMSAVQMEQEEIKNDPNHKYRTDYDKYIASRNRDISDSVSVFEGEYNVSQDIASHRYEEAQRERLKPRSIKEIVARSRGESTFPSDMSKDLDNLNTSVEIAKRYKRGRFNDSVVGNALSANQVLPISVLDTNKKIPHVWLSDKLLNTVKAISYDSVDSILKKMDIDRPAMTERVVSGLFRNKSFVEKFNTILQKNAADEMHAERFKSTKSNQLDVLSRTDRMLNDELLDHLTTGLNAATINEVRRVESDAFRRIVPDDINTERMNNDALFDHLKSKGILENDFKSAHKKIAEMETAFGRTERFRLSMPRNTISTLGKAFILTQLASNETILNIISNKVNKVADLLAAKEQGIDTGEHNSTYGSMRRLLLSDFGSKTRKFSKVSDIYSYVASKGDSALKSAKDKVADYYRRSASSKINPEGLHLTEDHFIYAGVGAAIGIGMMSLVPRSDTRSERKRYEQQKKKSLKRKREPQRSTDSQYQNPQSSLREQYKIHGQFGSPFLDKVGMLLQRVTSEEFITKLADGTISMARKLYSHGEKTVAKGMLLMERAEKLSSPDDYIGAIRRAGKSVEGIYEEATQKIREIKVPVVSRERAREMYKSGMGKMDEYREGIKRKNIISKIGESVVAPDFVFHGARNGMPIVIKPAPVTRDNLMVVTKGTADVKPGYSAIPDETLREQPIFTLNGNGVKRYNNLAPTIRNSSTSLNMVGNTTIEAVMRNASAGKTRTDRLMIEPSAKEPEIVGQVYDTGNRRTNLQDAVVPETRTNLQDMSRANEVNNIAMFRSGIKYYGYGRQRDILYGF